MSIILTVFSTLIVMHCSHYGSNVYLLNCHIIKVSKEEDKTKREDKEYVPQDIRKQIETRACMYVQYFPTQEE